MTESIISKKDNIIEQLKKAGSSDEKFRLLIQKGRELEPLSEEGRQDKFLVKGCISRAWLFPRFENGKVHFSADSEAAIVKGIIALLMAVYSDETPEAILGLDAGFLIEAGVAEQLSMNRRNGLANITKQIKLYATAYQAMAKLQAKGG